MTIAIDFDGTLAIEGQGYEPGTGPPLPGAIEFLTLLIENGYDVVIFSLTASYAAHRIHQWLSTYAAPHTDIGKIRVTHEKPHAIAYIDNRAIRFEGTFPTLDYLRSLS